MQRRTWKVTGTPTTTAGAAHFGRAPGARRVRGSTLTLTRREVAVLARTGAGTTAASAVRVGPGRRRAEV
ncbi:MAG: hypothetical protein M3046_04940 [Actinomycetota bacterium]|nr:hypothetical protein [Actinomycetota bacterium]